MTITTDNYEHYLYLYAEGELDADGQAAMEAFLVEHPELAEELSFYDPSLKLEAIPQPCPNKEQLLHPATRIVPLWRWVAAACVVGLLIGGAYLLWPAPACPPTLTASTHFDPVDVCSSPAVPQVTSPVPQSQPTSPVRSEVREESVALPHPTDPSPVTVETERVLASPVVAFEDMQQLADAEPSLAEPVAADTTVIKYIDITPTPSDPPLFVMIEADSPTLSDRFRSFRTRCKDYIHDYAYTAYSEVIGAILPLG